MSETTLSVRIKRVEHGSITVTVPFDSPTSQVEMAAIQQYLEVTPTVVLSPIWNGEWSPDEEEFELIEWEVTDA